MDQMIENWLNIPYNPEDWLDKSQTPWQQIKRNLESVYEQAKIKFQSQGDVLWWVKFYTGEKKFYSIHYLVQRDENDEKEKYLYAGIRIEKPSTEAIQYCLESDSEFSSEEYLGLLDFLSGDGSEDAYAQINNSIINGDMTCEFTHEDEEFFSVENLESLKELFDNTSEKEHLIIYLGKYYEDADLKDISYNALIEDMFNALMSLKIVHDNCLSRQKLS